MKISIEVVSGKKDTQVTMTTPPTGLLYKVSSCLKYEECVSVAEFFNSQYTARIDTDEFNGDVDLAYHRTCSWLANAFACRTAEKFKLSFTLDTDTQEITFEDVQMKGDHDIIELRERLMEILFCSNMHRVDYESFVSNFQSDLYRFLTTGELLPDLSPSARYLNDNMKYSDVYQENTIGKYVIISKRSYIMKLYMIPLFIGVVVSALILVFLR